MKVVRRGVFETNSSSMHSLSIEGKDNLNKPEFVSGRFGEFGWGYDSYSDVNSRLSYLLVAIANLLDTNSFMEDKENVEDLKNKFLSSKYFQWTNEVVEDFTGNGIIFDWEDILREKYYPFGYIDHQSNDSHGWTGGKGYIPDVLFPFWSEDSGEFKHNMKDYIFNNKYCLIIDNDNH